MQATDSVKNDSRIIYCDAGGITHSHLAFDVREKEPECIVCVMIHHLRAFEQLKLREKRLDFGECNLRFAELS